MSEKKKLAAVVFDMAGTTVDEGKTVYMSVRDALENFGYQYTLEEVVGLIGGFNKKEGIRLLISKKNKDIPESHIEEVFDLFLTKVETAYQTGLVQEMKGATTLFKLLRAHGVKVVLDTGYFRSTADILIDRMGWKENGFPDLSITSDEVAQGRPHPDMIMKAMTHFDIKDPTQVVKIGDTRSDMEEGQNAGCEIIVGITSDQYNKQDLLEMGATHAIDELSEMERILF